MSRTSDGKMFAMSGMRHEMYKHISTFGMHNNSCSSGGLSMNKDASLKALENMVCPESSPLQNHRQRFALQQCFIIQVKNPLPVMQFFSDAWIDSCICRRARITTEFWDHTRRC
jgi:hypothetical protein